MSPNNRNQLPNSGNTVSAYVNAIADKIGSMMKDERNQMSDNEDDEDGKTILESDDEDNRSKNEE